MLIHSSFLIIESTKIRFYEEISFFICLLLCQSFKIRFELCQMNLMSGSNWIYKIINLKTITYLLRFINRPNNISNCISFIMLCQLKLRIKSGC